MHGSAETRPFGSARRDVSCSKNADRRGVFEPGWRLRNGRGRLFKPIPSMGYQQLLVTTGTDFYNPRNTAMETVVTFIRMPGIQPESRNG